MWFASFAKLLVSKIKIGMINHSYFAVRIYLSLSTIDFCKFYSDLRSVFRKLLYRRSVISFSKFDLSMTELTLNRCAAKLEQSGGICCVCDKINRFRRMMKL